MGVNTGKLPCIFQQRNQSQYIVALRNNSSSAGGSLAFLLAIEEEFLSFVKKESEGANELGNEEGL